jgi:hypothetical protein
VYCTLQMRNEREKAVCVEHVKQKKAKKELFPEVNVEPRQSPSLRECSLLLKPTVKMRYKKCSWPLSRTQTILQNAEAINQRNELNRKLSATKDWLVNVSKHKRDQPADESADHEQAIHVDESADQEQAIHVDESTDKEHNFDYSIQPRKKTTTKDATNTISDIQLSTSHKKDRPKRRHNAALSVVSPKITNMSPVRCLRSTTKNVSPWTPTHKNVQKTNRLRAGARLKSPVKVMIVRNARYSKAQNAIVSCTADNNISSGSKLPDQESQQLLDMECDVEPGSNSSHSKVPLASVRLKKPKHIRTKMNKKAPVVDFTTSSPRKNQPLCKGVQYTRKKESSKVNYSSGKVKQHDYTTSASYSKWSDDQQPVLDMECDIEPESENDSSKTRFPVTAEGL